MFTYMRRAKATIGDEEFEDVAILYEELKEGSHTLLFGDDTKISVEVYENGLNVVLPECTGSELSAIYIEPDSLDEISLEEFVVSPRSLRSLTFLTPDTDDEVAILRLDEYYGGEDVFEIIATNGTPPKHQTLEEIVRQMNGQ